jgi:FkbM family methyltransferase
MKAIFYEGEVQDNYLGHMMNEVYREQLYDPYLLGRTGLTILDIGANIGVTAQYFSNYGKVYALEPSKEHFNCLTEMINFNKLNDKIIPINKALYIQSGKLPLYHNKNRTMYSLHTAVNDGSSKEEVVDCMTIDQLFKENNLEQVDFMKLDVEGSEVEILSGTGFKDVCEKIKTLIIESHSWTGRNPNQLTDVLQTRGYSVSKVNSEANIILARR